MNPNAPEFIPFRDLIDLDDSESVSSNSTAQGNISMVMTFRAKLSPDISGISDEYVSWNYQTIDSAVVKVFKLKRQFKVLYLIGKFISWCNVTSHKHLDLFELLLGLRKKSLVIAWAIVSGYA